MSPSVLMRSRQYRGLLVASSVIGVIVSLVSWAFLELTHFIQDWTYVDLPQSLGYATAPQWWPLPVLAIAGLLIAFAVVKLPGHGGHEPTGGLETAEPMTPSQLPGVVLAAAATIGLGLVLGPEAPLIAIGSGVALFLAGLSPRTIPDQGKLILGAAASFAALATIFGSPIVGAVIIIEAAGLGGPTLPVVLLPGLLAAGFGSLAFVGIGSLTGLSTEAYTLPPLVLPAYPTPHLSDFLWTIPLALVAACVVFMITQLARRTEGVVAPRPFIFYPAAAVLVGVIAVVFSEITGESEVAVLFSGENALSSVIDQAGTISVGTLALLVLCKALAWAISMGAARGGPTFPAILLGTVGGLLAMRLPGFAEAPAIGVLVGAAVVSVLQLPLSSILLALLITQSGAGVAPLIILAVAVAYIATLALSARGPDDARGAGSAAAHAA